MNEQATSRREEKNPQGVVHKRKGKYILLSTPQSNRHFCGFYHKWNTHKIVSHKIKENNHIDEAELSSSVELLQNCHLAQMMYIYLLRPALGQRMPFEELFYHEGYNYSSRSHSSSYGVQMLRGPIQLQEHCMLVAFCYLELMWVL